MRRLLAALLLLAACSQPQAEIALYGDSIIALMAKAPVVPPFDRAVNMGIDGNAASQVANRVEPIARIVFLEGGINSLGGGDPEPLTSSYARSLKKLASVQVRLIGILQVDESAPELPPTVTNSKIAAANALLTALCNQHPNCVPVTELMQMNMTGKTDGGVHPKLGTYKEITAILARYAK